MIGTEVESVLWSEKFTPQTAVSICNFNTFSQFNLFQSELAVHKKKVSEVHQWMEWALEVLKIRFCIISINIILIGSWESVLINWTSWLWQDGHNTGTFTRHGV